MSKLSIDEWLEFSTASRNCDFNTIKKLLKKYRHHKKLTVSRGRSWLEETAWVAMHCAHVAGDLRRVKNLLKNYPKLEKSKTEGHQSWLVLAIRGGSIPLVKFWLGKGYDVKWKKSLLFAQHTKMMHFLISKGANVNAWFEFWGTPLHHCTDPEQIRLLLKAGANPSIADNDGRTPLARMRALQRKPCEQALLEAGAPLEGKTPVSTRSRRMITGTVIVDIREDVPDFLEYVRQRVKQHVSLSRKDKKSELVQMIDFGFEFGQANWVALVFDTRKDAEPDGHWSLGIDKVMLRRPKWPIWERLADDAHVYFIDLSGKKIDVMPNPDKLICKVVGDALKHVLLTARDRGIFKALPKSQRCELGVENLEGFYGWPAYKDRGKENLV